MRRLFLLRHGKAEPFGGDRADFDRELAPRGRTASEAIGRYLSESDLLPDRVLCSTSARTRETLALVLSGLQNDPAIIFENNLYEASTEMFMSQIKQLGETAQNLLVVGHNPTTEDTLNLLCSGDPDSIPGAFPTCALAVIDCGISSWRELAIGVGVLAAFVRPRDLTFEA